MKKRSKVSIMGILFTIALFLFVGITSNFINNGDYNHSKAMNSSKLVIYGPYC